MSRIQTRTLNPTFTYNNSKSPFEARQETGLLLSHLFLVLGLGGVGVGLVPHKVYHLRRGRSPVLDPCAPGCAHPATAHLAAEAMVARYDVYSLWYRRYFDAGSRGVSRIMFSPIFNTALDSKPQWAP